VIRTLLLIACLCQTSTPPEDKDAPLWAGEFAPSWNDYLESERNTVEALTGKKMPENFYDAQSNPSGGVGGNAGPELKGIGVRGQEFREGDRVQVQGQVIKILPNGTCVIELARGQMVCSPAESCERIQ
jgi:hypothetical protein